MDQTSAHMQTETQNSQNQKNNENSPKHFKLLCSWPSTECESHPASAREDGPRERNKFGGPTPAYATPIDSLIRSGNTVQNGSSLEAKRIGPGLLHPKRSTTHKDGNLNLDGLQAESDNHQTLLWAGA